MSHERKARPRGFAAFAFIWSSQIVSVLTSAMTGFALTIWMYERTKSAAAMAAVQVFYIVPFLVTSFFAGPIVDRASRRLTMALSDVAAAIGTFGILLAFAFGSPEVWMIYASAALLGVGNSFQWPAFSAAISVMVPKEQLGRANGMMSLIEAGPQVIAPVLAGALLPAIGIAGILAMDVATFFVAVGTLFFVEIPRPAPSAEGSKKVEGGIVGEAIRGFTWIFERPSLLGLQLLFLVGNFFSGLAGAVMAPMVLARSGSDSLVFGGVQTAGAIGMVVGGLAMSAWGGFKKRTLGIVVGWIVAGAFGGILLGLGRNLWSWAAALALGSLVIPLMNGSSQAIWQSKVPHDLQGRVFSARRLIAWITTPITPLAGGFLADLVLEPAMRDPASPLAVVFGPIFGTGPGAGMGLLISLSGLVLVAGGIFAYTLPGIREAESLLPDAVREGEAGTAAADSREDGEATEAPEASVVPARAAAGE